MHPAHLADHQLLERHIGLYIAGALFNYNSFLTEIKLEKLCFECYIYTHHHGHPLVSLSLTQNTYCGVHHIY